MSLTDLLLSVFFIAVTAAALLWFGVPLVRAEVRCRRCRHSRWYHSREDGSCIGYMRSLHPSGVEISGEKCTCPLFTRQRPTGRGPQRTEQ